MLLLISFGSDFTFAQRTSPPANAYPTQVAERAANQVNEAKEIAENVQNAWERFTSRETAALFHFQAQDSSDGFAAIFCARETNFCERLGRAEGYSEAELSFLETALRTGTFGLHATMYGSAIVGLVYAAIEGAKASEAARTRTLAWHQGDLCTVQYTRLVERQAVGRQFRRVGGVVASFFGISGAGLYYYQADDLNQAIGGSRNSETGKGVRSAELKERISLLLAILERVPGLPRPMARAPVDGSFQVAERAPSAASD